MENRINRKVETYVGTFKKDIQQWLEINTTSFDKSDFLKFIFDYDGLTIGKDDFQKRKRIKNSVPQQNRCCAKRANGEQCTRRKKEDNEFCGTHSKGTPHGKVVCDIITDSLIKKKDIWVQEIKGIHYFIDENKNVYSFDDVLTNKVNPKIIAQYKFENDVYTIPEFTI